MKKNFRKIPDFIFEKIDSFDDDNFVIASVFKIDKSDIDNDKYKNLELSITEDGIQFRKQFVPSCSTGSYSRKNIDGYRVIHRDQKKITKLFDMGERPVFGDWSKGSFSFLVNRKIYPYVNFPPKELTISTELISETEQDFTIKVGVDFVLDRRHNEFKEELFFGINLLQENVYSIDVFPTTTTREEYLRSLTLSWEIFPPGERDIDLEKIFGRMKNMSENKIERVRRKYDYLVNLNPIEIISGVSGMRRYFGAKYSENLVVFENLNYGNAIYVLFENWKELTKLSRTEIQNRPSDQYIRVKHIGNWETKLKRIITNRRNGIK